MRSALFAATGVQGHHHGGVRAGRLLQDSADLDEQGGRTHDRTGPGEAGARLEGGEDHQGP